MIDTSFRVLIFFAVGCAQGIDPSASKSLEDAANTWDAQLDGGTFDGDGEGDTEPTRLPDATHDDSALPDAEADGSGVSVEAGVDAAICAIPCTPSGPCTVGVCVAGVCEQMAIAGACDDGNPCTVADACAGGTCEGMIAAESTCTLGLSCEATSLCAGDASCVPSTVLNDTHEPDDTFPSSSVPADAFLNDEAYWVRGEFYWEQRGRVPVFAATDVTAGITDRDSYRIRIGDLSFETLQLVISANVPGAAEPTVHVRAQMYCDSGAPRCDGAVCAGFALIASESIDTVFSCDGSSVGAGSNLVIEVLQRPGETGCGEYHLQVSAR